MQAAIVVVNAALTRATTIVPHENRAGFGAWALVAANQNLTRREAPPSPGPSTGVSAAVAVGAGASLWGVPT